MDQVWFTSQLLFFLILFFRPAICEELDKLRVQKVTDESKIAELQVEITELQLIIDNNLQGKYIVMQ